MAAKLSRPVVMFSTDNGLGIIIGATNGPDRHAADTDDAYAVTRAVQSTDVQAIVTTFGNDKAQPSAESARRGLSALGFQDPTSLVTVGSEGFLDAAPVSFVPAGQPAPVYGVNRGVKRMRDVLDSNSHGTATLFAIGPLTDVASLQRAYPNSFKKLKEIIALVGSFDGKPVLQGISVTDFNFAMDPTALGEVIALNNSVPVTCLMFEVTQYGTITNEVINQWISSGTAAQNFYGQATQPHAEYWDAIFADTDGQALFDAHTVYYFLNRDQYLHTEDMLATATVGGYPDTSAATTKNFFTVKFNDGECPEPSVQQDGTTFIYSGPVRGCYAFSPSGGGTRQFERTVQASVKSPFE